MTSVRLKSTGTRSAGHVLLIAVLTVLLAACGGGDGGPGDTPSSGWTSPVTLTTLDGDADVPRLAVDASGNVAAVWTQFNDTLPSPQYTLWSNYWRSGTGWLGAAELVHGGVRRPWLMMDAAGRNRVTWPSAAGDKLLFTEFSVTGAGPYHLDWMYSPSTFLTGSGLGNLQTVLFGSDQTLMGFTVNGSPVTLKASSGSNTGSSPLQLSGTNAASLPQLVRLSGDNTLVVWCENGVLTSRRFNGSSWAAAVQNSDGCVDKNLRLAVSRDGSKVVAAGQRNYKGELHVWRYDTISNAWSDAGSGGLPYPKDTRYAPAVAIDNAGRILLVWASFDADTSRLSLWASAGTRSYIIGVLTPLDGWSEPVRVDDTTRGNIATPQLALDSLGNAYAVWTQYNGHWDVLARHFNASTFTLGGIESLEGDTSDAYQPQLVFDSHDKAVVAWGFVSGISGDSHSGIRSVRRQ